MNWRRPNLGASVAVLFFAGLPLGCGTSDEAADQTSVPSETDDSALLSPADFEEFIAANSTAPLVNVHIPYEGHISGTDEFVPFEDIAKWTQLPTDKSTPIALYCRSGNMSGQAAAELAELGYTNVVDLEGGMKEWAGAGLDISGEEPRESLDGVPLSE